MREAIWHFLEVSESKRSRAIRAFLTALTVISIALIGLEWHSPEALVGAQSSVHYLEGFIAFVFLIEYGLRLWSSPVRIKHAFSFFGIVDLLSFAPYFILLVFDFSFNSQGIRVLRLLRFFQKFKIFRYSHMKIRTKIFMAFLLTMLLVLVPMLYYVYDYITILKEKDIKQSLLAQVIASSRQFNAESILKIKGETDPEYLRVQLVLRDLRDQLRESGIPIRYIYLVKKDLSKSTSLRYIVDAEEKGKYHSDFNSEYDAVTSNATWSLDFTKALAAPHFDYDDDGQTLVLSGAAPLPSLQSPSPVMLFIDILANDVEKGKRTIGIMVILTLGSAILVVSLFSFVFASYFNRPINELIKGIEAFEIQDFNYEVKILNEDELGRLGELFNTKLFVLMRDFFKFMYAPVAKMLLGPDRELLLEGKYEHASILFTDFKGFTAKSKEFAPRQVVEYLNKSFKILESIVSDHKGIIDKHIGDALMVYFIPLPGESNTARRALECALKMQEAYDEFYQIGIQKQELMCELRIGINSGDVILGAIGSEKLEVTVIGNSVNIANRMESASLPGGVGISKATMIQSIVKQWIHEFSNWELEETIVDVKHLDNVSVTLLTNPKLFQSRSVLAGK